MTFIWGRQIGWTERNSRSPSTLLRAGSPLRFASVPRQAGTGGMTISFVIVGLIALLIEIGHRYCSR